MPRLRYLRADKAWEQVSYHDQPDIVAVDTETTGTEFYDEPFAATLSWRGRDGSLQNAYLPLEGPSREESVLVLEAILRRTPAWVFHNAKFDLQKLLLIGAIDWPLIEQVDLHDTQTIYTLLDENGRKGLKHLAVTILKYDDTIQVPYKTGPKKGQTRPVSREKHELDEARRRLKLRKEDGYHLLPRRVIVPYALRDTDFTLRLYETLMPKLEAKDERLRGLYSSAMRLKRALLRMEEDGLGVDLEYLKATTSSYGVKVMESWSQVVALTGKPDLNPNAPEQLKAAFADRGVFLESTEADELKKLDDPLARAILEYREVKKLHKTNLVGLLENQRDGVAHPNFNDDRAKTGRMSSSSAKE